MGKAIAGAEGTPVIGVDVRTRSLSQLPKPPSRLSQGMVERRLLERRCEELRSRFRLKDQPSRRRSPARGGGFLLFAAGAARQDRVAPSIPIWTGRFFCPRSESLPWPPQRPLPQSSKPATSFPKSPGASTRLRGATRSGATPHPLRHRRCHRAAARRRAHRACTPRSMNSARARPSRLWSRAGLRFPPRRHRGKRVPSPRPRDRGRRDLRLRRLEVRQRQHSRRLRRGNRVAIIDPVYPVYVDTNVMVGHTGPTDEALLRRLLYFPAPRRTASCPKCPTRVPILSTSARPTTRPAPPPPANNSRAGRSFAVKHDAIILFDAAYEAYIAA